ncbi:FtsK/SpoIIIE domain-containing protein [Clostridium perfringens]|uniref:FtsK/SpoIIIE domain-containing protein n=1 Tax=Clostridium perfringens TaxID=1502 RepID=UPI001FB05C19|nr:FtsK/SpoIIIE domain-containing protein [Clostridium perfringens]
MSDNSTKFLEDFINEILVLIGDILKELFKVIVILFRRAGVGVKKSWRNKKLFIGLVPACLIPIVARMNVDFFFVDRKFYFKIIYFLLWFSPLYYFALVSLFNSKLDKDEEEFKRAFEEMGFIDISGKTPKLINIKYDELTGIYQYFFKTYIPLDDWHPKSRVMESRLNKTIIEIVQGANKQIVQMNALDGDVKVADKLLWSDDLIREEGVLNFGKSIAGEVKIALDEQPHVLVAGQTGSGKSVLMRCVLWQVYYQGADVYMIDFKAGVEFGLDYEKIGKVMTEVDETLKLLETLIVENTARLKQFRDAKVKNLKQYNKKFKTDLKRKVVFIDEVAQLMDSSGVDKETKAMLDKISYCIATLARTARATGIHLVLGAQRPDANIINGQIKNNVTVRVCGRFADGPVSEIVLGNNKAKKLPKIKGRFLFKVDDSTIEFQAYYFNDDVDFRPDEIQKLRKKQNECISIKSSDDDLIIEEAPVENISVVENKSFDEIKQEIDVNKDLKQEKKDLNKELKSKNKTDILSSKDWDASNF